MWHNPAAGQQTKEPPAKSQKQDQPKEKKEVEPKDKQDLQGIWMLHSGEVAGQKMDVEGGGRLVITQKFLIWQARGDEHGYRYQIDPRKEPKRIDLTSLEDGGDDKKAKLTRAIYVIDGDTLKLCVPEVGKDRPMRFSTDKEAGSGSILYVYNRAANPGKQKQ
jgi:uncharacterized protein (TIGR03067 family)